MKQQIYAPNTVPMANLAVNKSRIKIYKNDGELPTYYLQKGQEFQIELFNPTSDVVLTKIILNGKPISQGGLVLNPGQRVFLDRYLDVAKKFLFDTYEVANTAEVKKAIESNGDIKVEFYKEYQQYYGSGYNTIKLGNSVYIRNIDKYHSGTPIDHLRCNSSRTPKDMTFTTTNAIGQFFNSTSDMVYGSNLDGKLTTSYINTLDLNLSDEIKSELKKDDFKSSHAKRSKSIETGRVEMGSHSDQEFKYVNKSFEYFPFHTVEYKMLPVSQKVNTVADIQVKVYCTNCGSKLKKEYKFCPVCATRV